MVTRAQAPTRSEVIEVLGNVVDPEIPAISIIDLGIVDDVTIDDWKVKITCLPTFVGCPALDAIKEDILEALTGIGMDAEVRFVFQPPWSSDRISLAGRRKLEEYGLAPPPSGTRSGQVKVGLLGPRPCPFCGSKETVVESPFGPTLCRATYYCRGCRNPFEAFKPL